MITAAQPDAHSQADSGTASAYRRPQGPQRCHPREERGIHDCMIILSRDDSDNDHGDDDDDVDTHCLTFRFLEDRDSCSS